MSFFKFNPFRSMTLRGALVTAIGYTWAHVDPNAAGTPVAAAVLQGVGFVLTMLGVRNAIAKNGAGQ